MGQATLALRNLLIKAAIFVVLAAALAWAVGGTLFGSHRVNFPAVDWDGREWAVQVIGNGQRPDRVRWRLLSRQGEEPWAVHPVSETGVWRDLIGPVPTRMACALPWLPKHPRARTGRWSPSAARMRLRS